MNLKRIETFMFIVDYKSFSEVANMLGISQPAVSKQIKTLEKELGIPLLDRDSLEPTQAGKKVYEKGKWFVQQWQTLQQECKQLQGALTGRLHIGASTIPGNYIVPSLLNRLIDKHPQLEVQLDVYNSDRVLELLQKQQIDMGFIGIQPVGETFLSHKIATDQLQLIGPEHSEEVTDFADMKDQPFIFRSEGSGTWQAAQKGLEMWGYSTSDLKCVAKVDHTESVLSLVESGLGYSIVSNMAAEAATSFRRIKIIIDLPIEREFYAVYLATKKGEPTINALMNIWDVYRKES